MSFAARSSLLCLLLGVGPGCATFKEADLALKEWTHENFREKEEGEGKASADGDEANGKSKKPKAVKKEAKPTPPPDDEKRAGDDAQEAPAPTGTNSAAAEALFESGHEAMNEGDYDTACSRFEESNRLEPAVGAVLNLAVCEEKRGRLATAWTLFKQVMSELPAGDDRYPIAQRRASALRPRVPRVTLQLAPDAPEGTSVLYGDVVFGPASFNVPLPMDPGEHELVVSAPGHEKRSYGFAIVEGEKKELVVEPGSKKK